LLAALSVTGALPTSATEDERWPAKRLANILGDLMQSLLAAIAPCLGGVHTWQLIPKGYGKSLRSWCRGVGWDKTATPGLIWDPTMPFMANAARRQHIPKIGPLLDQLAGPVASSTGNVAYDQDSVYCAVIDRDPDAAVIVPPRSTAVPSVTAETEPTQRDGHLQRIAQ
jgi:hypothetical protein